MDTVNGIPALADADPAALIGQYSRDLRDIFKPAHVVLQNPDISVWQSHTVRAASILGLVSVNIRLRVGSNAVDGSLVAILPANMRPVDSIYGDGSGNTRDESVTFRISPNGDINIYATAAGLSNWISGEITFPSVEFPIPNPE